MLRRELLRFDRPDGGIDLFDPVFDRAFLLTVEEKIEVERGQMPGRLAGAILEEGPLADMIRAQWWARKRATVPPAPTRAPPAMADWEKAASLPHETIGPAWREPESWRRLAEDRAAGAYALPMRGLLEPDFAHRLAAMHARLAYERMNSGITFGDRHVCTPVDGGPVAEWLAVMASSPFRSLMGAVLAAELPAQVTANAWRMDPGDEIRAHPVGTTYVATLSLGLCEHWVAAHGGAIAFADAAPGEPTFSVRARWLPHLGDALAIARGPASWHWVETPSRERRTLTGWWVQGNGAG